MLTNDSPTPGPWKAERFERDHNGVALTGYRVMSGRIQICEAYPAPHPVAVNESNAATIAAAPELVAHLHVMVNEASAAGSYSAPHVTRARALLARLPAPDFSLVRES